MIVFVNPPKEKNGNIYPDKEFLEDYKEESFADFVCTLIVETITGNSLNQLGDSQTFFKCEATGKRGKEGIEELKTFAKEFVKISKNAIPQMSKKYQDFYNHFLNDLEKNGFVMPAQGRIPLD